MKIGIEIQFSTSSQLSLGPIFFGVSCHRTFKHQANWCDGFIIRISEFVIFTDIIVFNHGYKSWVP